MGMMTERLHQKENGRTLVEIYGTGRVLVERHSGIRAYGSEKVTIGTSYGALSVCGSELRLCCMSREQVFISGKIQQILLERRDS